MTMQMNTRLPETLNRMPELAYNMWFSWNEDARELFRSMDPAKWEEVYHNPVRLLQELSEETLNTLAQDSSFVNRYDSVMKQWDQYKSGNTWFRDHFPQHAGKKIAYFSAEFGFHESLPIYSGGLGVLAGDHMKSASDLGLPLVGVGLLYKKGYFNQKIDSNGSQVAEQVVYDFNKLAIRPATVHDQELIVGVILPHRTVFLKVWYVMVGTVPVYLLDADIDKNSPEDRSLTAQLYGGNQDTRIQQEMLLGIGGLHALRAFGLYPHVYHINEGHAAFLSLERIREHVYAGLPFQTALEMVRASTVFTTHTPVPAGHDAFSLGMFEHYMGALLTALPNDRKAVIDLGLDHTKNVFNMTYLAMNTATLRNGVSKLHGEVSREMFKAFHGNMDVREVPIRHVTNGVHLPTWLAEDMKKLYGQYLAEGWMKDQPEKDKWKAVSSIPSEDIWNTHMGLKKRLVEFARANIAEQRRRNGESQERIDEAATYLDPKALTIGFARRFATYKRATLIFNDHDRLDRLVNDPERPVQFIFAGKAHPADHPGQELIREIYKLSQMDRFRGKVVLLENYDMNMARYLVQGVDVWLNNPRRPYEASGTSGQKAAMNGVLNFSVLDGWWEEGYDGENGWAIEANNDADFETQERENTESLYSVFERSIVPLYYGERGDGEIPAGWVRRMLHAVVTLAPEYNTDRMVAEYTTKFYSRTMDRAQQFSANNYEVAGRVADYKRFIRESWSQVKFVHVDDNAPLANVEESLSKGLKKSVKVTVSMGPVWYKDVVVEAIYWEENGGSWDPVLVPFRMAEEKQNRIYVYQGEMPAHLRHGPHYQLRVRPVSPDFAHDFELHEITRM